MNENQTIKGKGNSISSWIIFVLAAACGLIVANLYYSQTLVGPISAALGLSSAVAGFIVTFTQMGYVAGLLFIVPLSDLVENRRLAITGLILVILALWAAAYTPHAPVFLAASFLIGLGSVVAQVLVPFAAYLAPEGQQGRVVGNVMSGLLLGIMFARPVASFLADIWGWKSVFGLSAMMITLLAILLACVLPKRTPSPAISYGKLLYSMGTLFTQTPVLRRRALYQACLFGAFSMFWTVVPLRLADDFGMSQQGIAWFALAGVGGAVAAPIAGRLADKGGTRLLTGLAMMTAALSFLMTYLVKGNSAAVLAVLVVAAILLDMAVSGNLVLSQRAIYSLGSESRGRLNGLFMSIFFIGGAVGSSLGGWSYAYGGWSLTSLFGVVMLLGALLYYLTEKRTSSKTSVTL